MLFEKRNRKTATIYRDDKLIGSVYADLVSPKLEEVSNAFASGYKMDLEAFLQDTYELKIFDVIEIEGIKYKVQTFQKYKKFYYVLGVKLEND